MCMSNKNVVEIGNSNEKTKRYKVGIAILKTSTFGVFLALVSSPPGCIEVNDNY